MTTQVESCQTRTVKIWMAGDIDTARASCRKFCISHGLCVTLIACDYIYTGGMEAGFCVTLINYPRFPHSAPELLDIACKLADRLIEECCQQSYTIQSDNKTIWISRREELNNRLEISKKDLGMSVIL